MLKVEIRAGEGGEDAEDFASRLTAAVTKWSSSKGLTVKTNGFLAIDGDQEHL